MELIVSTVLYRPTRANATTFQNTRLARFHSLVTVDPLPTINEETYSDEW